MVLVGLLVRVEHLHHLHVERSALVPLRTVWINICTRHLFTFVKTVWLALRSTPLKKDVSNQTPIWT